MGLFFVSDDFVVLRWIVDGMTDEWRVLAGRYEYGSEEARRAIRRRVESSSSEDPREKKVL